MITGIPKAVFFATLLNKRNEGQKYERDTRGISVTWGFPGGPQYLSPVFPPNW